MEPSDIPTEAINATERVFLTNLDALMSTRPGLMEPLDSKFIEEIHRLTQGVEL